jgi:hypothetical protein
MNEKWKCDRECDWCKEYYNLVPKAKVLEILDTWQNNHPELTLTFGIVKKQIEAL